MFQIKRFIDTHPLSGKHRIKAYTRFISWQLQQFFYRREKIVPFIGTTKLSVSKGMTGATGNIYTGLHEFTDMGFLLHFLRGNDLFFDIGANIGSYTILAAGHVGSRTIAFEPVSATFNSLVKNIELNKLKNIATALNIGLGKNKSVLHFTKNLDTVNHVVYDLSKANTGSTIEVPVESVDEMVLQNGVPNLVKIDVEGFETEVLAGMLQTLKQEKLKAIIIELNGSGKRYGFDEDLLDAQLRDNKFIPYTYDPFKRNLVPVQKHDNLNTIYIRDINFVTNRLMNAKKIKVFSEEF
ncbi:MAG: FkbM family methyltransferase [Ferruginibacter sp.]|nr:FkbM family methyltransferase [Ferruginibacter sp.]